MLLLNLPRNSSINIFILNRVKDRGGLQASSKGIYVFNVLLRKTSVNKSQLVSNSRLVINSLGF